MSGIRESKPKHESLVWGDAKMDDTPIDSQLKEGMKVYANYIAVVIQNTMKDFDSKTSSGEQSEQRDHVLRSAIYTALYSYQYCRESDSVEAFLKHHLSMVPDSWEEPELLGAF